jgi:hypothetical protein
VGDDSTYEEQDDLDDIESVISWNADVSRDSISGLPSFMHGQSEKCLVCVLTEDKQLLNEYQGFP